MYFCFFFNDTATTEIYTLSLHDALPIYDQDEAHRPHELGDRDLQEPDALRQEERGNDGDQIGRAHV